MKKSIVTVSKFMTVVVFTLVCVIGYAQQPQGLQVNQVAPNFSGKDQNGKSVSLKSALKKGPVVLVFYRGEWCPYCNKYLKDLEQSLAQVTAKGGTIIAITPETPESTKKTIQKTQATFSVLNDKGLKIMKSYDVAFKLDDKTLEQFKKYNIDLNKNNGENGANLPVPAVYVIGKSGKIAYRFFDPDYTKRAPVTEIVGAL